ncbi:ParA family protein [Thermoanaerobacterium thermosaccharolyticum]|uniref:ParA family protein n=1 Tax=Thermoanaerobacterium thermosaccharolyticum TaxID=1517 RepID=UPI003D2AE275
MIISIANQKGGVGKTTTTLNLGVALTKLNKKVLMIDMDPQASLTISLGIEPTELKQTIYNALIEETDIKNVILYSDLLYFIPSTIDLSAAELELVSEIGRESKLHDLLENIKDSFDYIIIDCPPSLGLLTVNALVASNAVIVPMSPEYLALRGFGLLQQTIAKVKKLNKSIELMGVLVTMFDGRTSHHKEILTELKNKYPVFESVIKKSVKFPDAVLAGQSIIDFDESFDGAEAYKNLAEEVISWHSKELV